IWCVAHSLWLGTSFMLLTSLGLIAHHSFAVWHGDRRWQTKYGEAFTKVKERTSIIPFKAIWEGRQSFKAREFLTPAYGGVTGFIFLLWWGHPWLMQVTAKVFW
ncbi:MAG: NnrU family protein, partial [Microcystaceae cyanobacterium]